MAGTAILGWSELREGRWDAARTAFERELAERETAEALEGLSWAAWWQDDAPAVFDARERAYRRYRAVGSAYGAARMATWLAADELDFHGAAAVAAGWLQRAHRLLDQVPASPEHGWLAFHEGYTAHRSGDGERARRLGREATRSGRSFDVPDLEMLGLALEGASLVAAARVPEGMRRLDEATAAALAGEATIPISSAWTCCFLVSACTAVRDFERAFEWCDRIAAFASRYGSRYMLGFCRAEYGVIHLWRGRWPEAETALRAALDDFAESRPAYVGGPLAALAELSRRRGRRAEALHLLDRAGATSAARLCRARIALDDREPPTAIELVERLLRQAPAETPLYQAAPLELLVRARAAAGRLDEARAALEPLRELARLAATAPLLAAADHAEGTLAAAQGDHERARRALGDAVDGFERSGAPYEAAQARGELAASLAELGEHEPAAREVAAARRTLNELGGGHDAEELPITPREREVLALLAEGLTNRKIAERLVVSEHTVHRHVTSILRKLDLPSRAAAAARAARAGL